MCPPVELHERRIPPAAIHFRPRRRREQARQANARIFGLENALKAYTGEYSGLTDPKILAKKSSDEKMLRDQVAKKPEWQAKYGGAWATIQRAQEIRRREYKHERFGQLRGSSLAPLGLTFVQYAAEIGKPDGAVGEAEIVGHGKAHAQGDPDRRGRITGEVAEYLPGERQRRDPAVEHARNFARRVVNRLDHWRESIDDKAWTEMEEYITWWVVKGYALRVAETMTGALA